MKHAIILFMLASFPVWANVVMAPDITPDPVVELNLGQILNIDFITEADSSFFGAVKLTGVGEFLDVIYYDPSGIIPPIELPPIPIPEDAIPVFYDGFSPAVVPLPFRFQTIPYFASETGNASIDFYAWEETFSQFVWIDSFDITVIPEPASLFLLMAGGLLIRRR